MAKKGIGIPLSLDADETSFTKALRAISAESKKTTNELNQIEKALQIDPQSTVLLAQKQQMLTKSITDTKNTLVAFKSAQDKADADMGNGVEINQTQYRKLQREIIAAENSLKKLNAQASGNILAKPLDNAAASAKKFDSSIDNAKTSTKQLNSEVTKTSTQANKLSSSMSMALKGVVAGYTGKALVEYLIGSNAQMEQYTTSFEVMLGSASKAKTLMSDLTNFANTTPLQLTDVTKDATLLINYGVAADDVIGKLTQLGDLSLGNAEKLDRISLAYGQMLAKGKVTGEELRQMTEVGVPLTQALADSMGITTAKLSKMIEAGKVGIPDLNSAVSSLTTGTGKFAGMMEKQSKTMSGMLSTLKDNFAQFGRDVGEEAFEQVKGSIQDLLNTMDKASKDGTLAEVAEEIGNSINTLVQILTGAIKIGWEYRDVLIAGATAMATFKVASAASTAITALSTALKSAGASQLEFNLACEANPYVLVASAIVGITVGLVAMTKRLNEAGGETNGLAEKYKSLNDEAKSLDEQSKSAEAQNDKEVASIKVKEERYETLRLQYEKTGQGLDALKQASQDLQSVLPSEISMIDAQTGAYLNLSNTIDAVLAKKYKQAQSDNLEKKAENAYSQIQVLEQQKQDKIDEAAYWKQQLSTIKNGLSSDGYTQPYLEEMANEAEKELKSKTDAFDKSIAKQQKIIDDYKNFSITPKTVGDYAEENAKANYKSSPTEPTEISEDFKSRQKLIDNEHDQGKKSDSEYYAESKALLAEYTTDETGVYSEYFTKLYALQKSMEEKAKSALTDSQKSQADNLKTQFENGIITEEEYYNKLEALAKTWGKNGTEYLTEVYKGRKALAQKATEDAQKSAEDELKAWETGFDKIADSAKTAFDDISKKQEDMATKLADTGDLFTVKGDTMSINDISDQTEQLKKYQAVLEQLKSAGASKEFMSQFTSMDVTQGLDYGQSILSGNISQYFTEFEEKQKVANEIASNYYADDVNTLKTEFTDKIKNSLAEMPATANLIGQDTASEFVKGMKSKLAELNAIMNLAAQQSMITTISSPSTNAVQNGNGGSTSSTGTITNQQPQTTTLQPVTIALDGNAVGQFIVDYTNKRIYQTGGE